MRKQYELTDEQWEELKSKRNPFDLYEAWKKIGKAQGFDWMTAEPISVDNPNLFTAEEWDGKVMVGKI